MENKDKLMVCVDTQGFYVPQLQYCFVRKEIERDNIDQNAKMSTKAEIEFNMKVNEIQRKLKLGSMFRFMYLLNGRSIFELDQIPRNENVVIISRERELTSIEDIIQNDLVSDFYEYGMKKDIPIYSKSQVETRMNSLLEAKYEIDRKYREVLKVFDDQHENQLDSEQLALLVNLPKDMPLADMTASLHKSSQKKDTSVISERTEKPSTDEQVEVDYSSMSSNKSYRNKVTFKENSEKEKKGNIKQKEYLKDDGMLMENKRLGMYKEIMKYYKNLNKIKIDPQEPDQQFINAAEADEDDEELHNINNIDDVSKNLDVLLKRLQNPRKKLDYLDIKKELERIKADNTTTQTYALDDMIIAQSEEKVLNPEDGDMKQARNYIQENIKTLNTKKGDIEKLYKGNRELFIQNIPKQIQDRKLTRRELHVVYILYKALCEVTSQRYKHYNFEDGIDYHSFRNGIYQVFLQSEEVAEKIFYRIDHNFSGFLNWEEFLNAMMIIRARTLRDKIDLFIKIADEDENGNLSKEEIFNLAKICLGKFIKDKEDGFLDNLCEYFTRLIFSSVGVDLDQEIPLQAIKDAIISQGKESDLLAMFCGADI